VVARRAVLQHVQVVVHRFDWLVVDLGDDDVDQFDFSTAEQLNATLTLGVFLSLRNDRQLTLISHSVAKPPVTGWRTSLAASNGEVQKILNATKPLK
jgi:hypothetical protein